MTNILFLTTVASGVSSGSGSVPSADSTSTHIDAILQYGLDRLPQSPVKDVDLSSFSTYMGVINYFIPVGALLGILSVFHILYLLHFRLNYICNQRI